MNLQEIIARQEAIRAELQRIESDSGADEATDGDWVDTLVADYDRLSIRRTALQRLRAYQATRPGLRARPGQEGSGQ